MDLWQISFIDHYGNEVEIVIFKCSHSGTAPVWLYRNVREIHETNTALDTTEMMIAAFKWSTKLNDNVCVCVCVVNGSKVGPFQLETFFPNVTEFFLRVPDRSSRYKFFLSALTQVGKGEDYAEESPHFTNEGEAVICL